MSVSDEVALNPTKSHQKPPDGTSSISRYEE